MHAYIPSSCFRHTGIATASLLHFFFSPPLFFSFYPLLFSSAQACTYAAKQITSNYLPRGCSINAILHGCQQCDSKVSPHQLPVALLPPLITRLDMHAKFNKPLPPLPHSLTYLSFGTDFNHPVNNLPPNLKQLKLSERFNHSVDYLPHALTHLTFGEFFNQPLNRLPSGLLQLKLGTKFNQPLNHLPALLTHLLYPEKESIFHHSLSFLLLAKFNYSMDNIPSSITHLDINAGFCQPITSLPPSLTHFRIGDASLIPIDPNTNLRVPTWPPALRQLTLFVFDAKGFHNLPSTVTHLSLHWYSTEWRAERDPPMPIPYFLPRSVEFLVIRHMPPTSDWTTFSSLKSLITNSSCFQICTYPPTLTSLSLSYPSVSSKNLPHSLTHLTIQDLIGTCSNMDHLPPNLTFLCLGCKDSNFNGPLGRLPPALLQLIIHSERYNQPIGPLPSSLRRLTLKCKQFNQPLDHLPPFLTHLSLRDHFNQPLHHLPTSLTSLRLGKYFCQPLLHLPQSLSVLKVNFTYIKEKGVSLDSLPPFVSVIHRDD